ncbi:MAG: glycosyltransferase family 4 protein [bacterium]|nr:glycosyltransferase family 4 protein [bacterium]
MRTGDRVTVLTPHAAGVDPQWNDDGVAVRSFRYAPSRWELVGYSRSLDADEKVKGVAAVLAPLYALGAWRAVSQELRRRNYDLLQAHWVVPNGLISSLLAQRVPLAVGLHGSDVFLAEKAGVRWLVGRALRRTSVLTGCSPELVDRVCALGFASAYARVIPYGVDYQIFSPRSDDPPTVEVRTDWREKLGIPQDSPLVLSVGRMATKKGYQVLIEALPDLFEQSPDCHFVLAGAGDRLEEFRAATAAWADRVHFPGVVLRDILPDLYRSADIFVLPAVHDPQGNVDGLPNVILEAMASALPVVATRISGIPLAIDEGEEGLLVPEQDSAALGKALLALLRDLDKARAMGECGRRRVLSELSWDAVAGRYRQAYELALTAH